MCIRDRTYAGLLARGFDLAGSAAGETIRGTSVDDRIDGRGGADTLLGGRGSDSYFYAVSYTHLDVYKRQGLRRALGARRR